MTATMEQTIPVHELPLPPRSGYHGRKFTKAAFTGIEEDDTGFKMAHKNVGVLSLSYPRIKPNFLFDTLLEHWSGETVMVISPEAVRELYSVPPRYLDHEHGPKFTVLATGSESPFFLSGKDHVEVRRAMVPEFTAGKVTQYHAISVKVLDRMIDELPLDTPVSLLHFYTRLTQEIILRVSFGFEDGPELEEYKAALYEAGLYCMTDKQRMRRLFGYMWNSTLIFPRRSRDESTPIAGRPDLIPRWSSRRGARIRQRTDELILRKVREFRERPQDCVVSRMVAFGDERGWSEKRFRDVIATLLLAGHDTSVSAYSWATEYLMHNPGPRAKVVAEAIEAKTDAYAQAANLEATRIKSPVWGLPSVAMEDFALTGYRIRKGTFIFVLNTALHHHPELYPDSRTFRPERFLEQDPDRFGFMSFNTGRHRCPGIAFYLMEASLVTHRMFGRLELEPTLPRVDQTLMQFGFFQRPRHRTVVRVRSRKPASDVPIYSPAIAAESSIEVALREDGEASVAETLRPGCPYTGDGALGAGGGAR